MHIFKNIVCQWDKRSSVVGGIWSIKIVLQCGFYQLVSLRNGSRSNIFFSGALFLEENMDHTETFFSGMGLFYIFSGFDHRVCYQNSKNEPCIYIYRDHVFWKINRDNSQWVISRDNLCL